VAAHLRRLIEVRGRPALAAGRPRFPARRIILAALGPWMIALHPAAQAQSFDELVALDTRVAVVADRLLTGNAALCRNHAPVTGMIVHSRDQYAGTWADNLFPAGPLAIAAVLPGSPAAAAGLHPGDVITDIDSQVPLANEGTLREAALKLMASRWRPGEGVDLQISRDGAAQEVALDPLTGCGVTVEVATDDPMSARTDGAIIKLGFRLVQAATDNDLAVILAHELGHVVLRHRERLAAAAGGEDRAARRYRRAAEEEADSLSPYIVANAGVEADLVPAFWQSALGRRVNHGLLRSRAYPPLSRRISLTQAAAGSRSSAPILAPPDLLARRDQPIVAAD
jgi:hypothetical protein